MSRQGNIISTVLHFCKRHQVNRDETLEFLVEVLQDAGQIESDEDGEISQDDREWLLGLIDRKLGT